MGGQARARVWTLCLDALILCALILCALILCALILCALTGPVVGLLTPLAQAPAPALTLLAAILAAALVGASVALAVLLIAAVRHVVRPRLDGYR